MGSSRSCLIPVANVVARNLISVARCSLMTGQNILRPRYRSTNPNRDIDKGVRAHIDPSGMCSALIAMQASLRVCRGALRRCCFTWADATSCCATARQSHVPPHPRPNPSTASQALHDCRQDRGHPHLLKALTARPRESRQLSNSW